MENSDRKTISAVNLNDEINFVELIDSGRKYVNGDNVKLGEHYLNLAILCPNIDAQSKLQASAIKSFAHFKKDDLAVTVGYANKTIKFLRKIRIETLDTNILLCAIRMLYRAACILKDYKFPYLACFYVLTAIKIFDVKALRGDRDNNETLTALYNSVLENISSEIKIVKEKFLIKDEDKKEINSLMFARLKKLFSGEEKKTPGVELDDSFLDSSLLNGDKYYLISAVWVKNLVTFINKFEKYSDTEKFLEHLDKIFSRNDIINLYLCDEANFNKSGYGIYPGQVNNFFIADFKDAWIDPDESQLHTNVYIKNGLKENADFFFVTEKDWDFIKSQFGYNFEILRKTANISNNLLIEVYLRKIKVLILNDRIRENSIDLIRPRSIQISKEMKIKDLKEKLIRCIKDFHPLGEAGSKNTLLKIKLYLFSFGLKENKKETFELIYAYCNKLKSHKMLAEEVMDDEVLIENFKYGPGDLLVAEVDTEFIELISEQKHCNLCESTINEPIKCLNCSTYLYCSDNCRKKDTSHLIYHTNINKLYKKKFNLQEIFEIKIEDLLDRGARHALVGLKNLGNTCFMNSALQCLSHCEELTKYFLTRKVFDEINKNNSHGTGGEVAKAYYELLKELWQGDSPYLCPTDFRQIFVRFVRQFAGFSQHDSHEMLTFMLDTLHEDLNRVRQKPYVEMKEKFEKETDLEASQRWWKNHLTRENSIIVDLFHGQYKSVITCPECNRISITYDPFMYLGLPIPSGHFKIKFKFFPYFTSSPNNYIYEYELPLNDHTTVKDLKLKVLSSKSRLEFKSLEAIALTKEKSFKKILREDEFIFGYFDNGYEIVICEKYPSDLCEVDYINYSTFYLFPTELIEERSMLFMKKSSMKLLSYPTIVSLNNNSTIRDLLLNIYKAYRKILRFDNYCSDDTEENFNANFGLNEDSSPFRLHVINNVPDSNTFFSSKSNCEFCGTKCEYCLLGTAAKTYVQDLINIQRETRPFLFYVEIKKLAKNSKLYENLNFPINLVSKNLIYKQSSINIYDCINLFRSEERLEKENAWYCSQCKEHQEAFKRLEIYKPPNFLTVQFKRFKIRSNSAVIGMIANKKNDVLIEYPIDGLDLREYVVGTEKDNAVYDLVGISQHFGGLSSGHYTALCRNGGKWYEFDDDRVLKATSSDVVTSSAYMLFYRKRKFNMQ